MKKGKIIVIEGSCDGVGKSTQYNILYEHLIKDGLSVFCHKFPSYNTNQGKLVEMYLNGEFGDVKDLSPYFVNSLFAIDRAVTWNFDLKSKYDNGSIILADRYTTSSIIYQSALIEDIDERKKFIDYICDFEYNKLGIKKPDNVIFLYMPFKLATELRKKRVSNDGISNDIHEKDLAFMKKVYDNAMFVADYLSWTKVLCSENGKMKTKEAIHDEIYNLLTK